MKAQDATDMRFSGFINVNGKLQEMILNLLHQQRVHNTNSSMAVFSKLERSILEFENFYSKFGLNDKLRMGQTYYILAKYHYDHLEQCRMALDTESPSEEEQEEMEASYGYIERALGTFRDCNRLAAKLGLNVDAFDPDRTVSVHHEANEGRYRCELEDVGYFWSEIFEIYILGMFWSLILWNDDQNTIISPSFPISISFSIFDWLLHQKGGHILLGNKQYDDARVLYEFAYGLVLHVEESTALHAMVALEQLVTLSMLQQHNIQDTELYLNRILHILKHEAPNTRTVDIEAEEEEEEMEHIIQALNVKAHYSCILSLCSHHVVQSVHSDGNEAMYRMKRAMDLAAECLKEWREKFGPHHASTLAMYLYFGLHFVNIELFDSHVVTTSSLRLHAIYK